MLFRQTGKGGKNSLRIRTRDLTERSHANINGKIFHVEETAKYQEGK